MTLVIEAGLDSFYNALKKSFREHNIKVSEEADFYVFNLLTEYLQSDKFFIPGVSDEDKALAVMLKEAYEAPTKKEQILKLVVLGDRSFFISSYFSGCINNRNFKADNQYCKSLGSRAYMNAGGLYSPSNGLFAKLYYELGEKFDGLVSVASAALEHNL